MKRTIPIFPLNLVMYPGSIYPLHIFEERYKRMIKSCSAQDTGFGIISKLDSDIATIGCYVEILEIYNVYDNGNMDILVKGISKFRTKATELHQDGYIQACVSSYNDARIDQNNDYSPLLKRTLKKFRGILLKTEIELGERFWSKFKESDLKSYKIAEKSGLSLRQQQNLLSLRSEIDRLQYLFDHFKMIEEYFEKNKIAKDIILGDGFIN